MEVKKGKLEMGLRVPVWSLVFFMILVSSSGGAEDPAKFPSKPITLIVPLTAGGAVDVAARKLGDLASRELGQPIIVENKPGGGATIGISAVAKAPSDGYTLGTTAAGAFVFVPLMRSVPYKPKEDLTYLMQYAAMSFVFAVRPDSRWKTLKDFIEDAKGNPGKLSYAAAGPGGNNHVFFEQILSAEKVKVNYVPTGGGAEATLQALGGHVDSAITAETAPHVESGKLRGLAVQGETRLERFPDIPTFYELGYKVDTFDWIALASPKGLEPRIFEKLCDAFKKAAEAPSFKEVCSRMHVVPSFKDSTAFTQMLFRQIHEQRTILKEIGLSK